MWLNDWIDAVGHTITDVVYVDEDTLCFVLDGKDVLALRGRGDWDDGTSIEIEHPSDIRQDRLDPEDLVRLKLASSVEEVLKRREDEAARKASFVLAEREREERDLLARLLAKYGAK